jgi:endonuclease-8
MPEGDSIRRVAGFLRALEGEVLAVETPNPRAAALRIAERLNGRRLERVESVGKNLLLHFEDGVVLRSHLRMKGRWRLQPVGSVPGGNPWLILRGSREQAVLWHGPVLELGTRGIRGLGPDVLAVPLELDEIVRRARRGDPSRPIAEVLLDQRVVAGIGNLWKAETLHAAGLSPFAPVGLLPDDELRGVIAAAAELMRSGRHDHAVYRRAGRPCPRCAATVLSRPQGESARMTYWCPSCQVTPGGCGGAPAGTGSAEA